MAQGPDFVVHDEADDVGVVIRDVSANEDINGRSLRGGTVEDVAVTDDIPLGHKVALRDLASGANVTKYGTAIGVTTTAVTTGQHVHTQNVRSTRWPGN